jgi:hypothetical protein
MFEDRDGNIFPVMSYSLARIAKLFYHALKAALYLALGKHPEHRPELAQLQIGID